MKKSTIILIIAVLAVMTAVSGCGKNSADTKSASAGKKIKIVTTIFPEYDWVKMILGDKADNAEVTMLLDNGIDLHSYQPTTDDIAKVKSCDMFVYAGGESDAWVKDALKQANNKNMKVIDLMDVLGKSAKEEEVKEGMMLEEGEAEGEDKEPEYDEHVWLSLKNTKIFIKKIAEDLEKLDPENAEAYRKSEADYSDRLDTLDKQYQKTVKSAEVKTLVFGDRFPFRYMVDDYGLDYYAAFVGCSAETEASFETISYLAGKVDKLKLKNIITIDGSDQKIAKTIIKNTKDKDQNILEMDSMQSTNSDDVKKGKTYISVMEKNLKVLSKALQKEN